MASRRQILAGIADGLVVPAYGAAGFRLRRSGWADPDLAIDLTGRRFVVTGANGGIGSAAVRMLAQRGATVHLVTRSRDRGAAVRDAVAAETGNEALGLHVADLSSLASVRGLAEELDELPQLHGLAHNAGALLGERLRTADGLEATFATHVAGPFLLTALLEPLLTASAPSRVVFVSSGGMYTQKLRLDTLQQGGEPFDGVVAYAQAKRAQVILARRWHEALGGRGVSVSSMHPGWVDTPGVRSALPRFHRLTRAILRTPDQGADTLVWLLASPEAADAGGGFYLDRQRRREHLPLKRTRSSPAEIERLWRLCVDLTGATADQSRWTHPAGRV